MFKCHICGSTEAREEFVSEVFQIDGKPVLVENIPAQVCARCGEEIFNRETVEKVRLIVHEQKNPIKSVQMDVFAFA
ncbi:MAG: type II toxin-antitoxin system MqsA family antitoxin [Anaerolineales bacterium]|nr:type II toxin-antitoxin system MqsA family antitoxin [Anaerolineales bacterium]